MRKIKFFLAALLVCGLSFTAHAAAQQAGAPPNVIRVANGEYQPAPGYDWVTSAANDLRVRWIPGKRHSAAHPNVLAGDKENSWRAAPGFKWANNIPGDLRVVKAGPTDDDIGRAVLKVLGALALHEAGKPQRDDGILEGIARALSRQGRDELIESALQDLLPESKAIERAAIRGLVVLALDGRLERNRDRVVAQLRRTNPDMADAVEVAEFLIRLSQEVDRRR